MKIFILVLIFSLLYKLNCQMDRELPETKLNLQEGPEDKDEEDKTVLTYQDPELPESKLNAELQEGPEDKQDAEPQEVPEDKLNAELQEDPDDKDVDLQEGQEDKLNADLEEDSENKDVLQGDEEGDEIKENDNLDVPPDVAQDAELKEILTDKEEELQKGPAEKVDTVEALENEEGDEIKNKEQVPACEDCANDKESSVKGDEADQIPENNDENQVKKDLNLFPEGDIADLFGNNQHYKIPDNYYDFGRRFVLQYPYKEKKSIDEEAEDDLHNAVKQHIENKQNSHDLLPIKAPPEFVLEIAKRSLLLDRTKPKNPTDDIINKNILRSGNYWNDVRIEEIDPKKMLRSTQPKDNLESVKVEIKPGSKLYDLISTLKEKSPRLVYVINKDFD